MRQADLITDYDPKPGVSITTLRYEYPSEFLIPEHSHGSDQLIYAVSGLMEVSAAQGIWLVPPHFALWVPAFIPHRIRMSGVVSMRTLYLRPSLSAGPATHCAVLHVSSLLRELVVETVRAGALRVRHRYECALRELLLTQLRNASPIPISITLPRERRALAVAQAVLSNLAELKSMTVLCCEANVSVRTVERSFRKEVGSSFEEWRRQVRLMKAVELLISGNSVKEVAFKIGYNHPSAFIQVFRRTFGVSPKAWVKALELIEERCHS